jgi:hypothetical protein
MDRRLPVRGQSIIGTPSQIHVGANSPQHREQSNTLLMNDRLR